MMADHVYDRKAMDLQKYIPFLESLIQNFKNSQNDKRAVQLKKIEALYDLLTNKNKKLSIEALQKCEAALSKLYSKVDKVSNLIETQETLSKAVIASKNEPDKSSEKTTYCMVRNKIGERSATIAKGFADGIAEEEKKPTKRKTASKIDQVPEKIIKTKDEISRSNIIKTKTDKNMENYITIEIIDEEPESAPSARLEKNEGANIKDVHSGIIEVAPEILKSSAISPASEITATSTIRKPLADSQDCSVSSSTAIVAEKDKKINKKPEEENAANNHDAANNGLKQNQTGSGKNDETAKNFLGNQSNPDMVKSVLKMLERVLDEKQFRQVKTIINDEPASDIEKPPEVEVRRKNECDRLNEDIQDVFTTEGIVTDNSSRLSMAINEQQSDRLKNSTAATISSKSVTMRSEVNSCRQRNAIARIDYDQMDVASEHERCEGEDDSAIQAQDQKTTKSISKINNEKDGLYKNINREMHAQSKYAKECALCPFTGSELSKHYINVHRKSEVLISRLPPAEYKRIRANEVKFARLSSKGNSKFYRLTCPFCNFEYCRARGEWVKHFGIHTGEYIFKCSECSAVQNKLELMMKHIKNECPEAHPLRLQSQAGERGPIYAFICNLCDYVQMNRENIIKHLITQHDSYEQPIIKIILLTWKGMQQTGNWRGPEAQNVPSEETNRSNVAVCLNNIQSIRNEKDGLYKNINPEIHFQSKYVKACVLCPFVGHRLSKHYVNLHPKSEVLISRLPPATQARILANEGNAGFLSINTKKLLYRYACPFCNIVNSYTRGSWIKHFGTHTGEYTFKCSECSDVQNVRGRITTHIRNHCPTAHPIRLRTVMLETGPICAFICNLCNYVQMNKEHIVKHLSTQHDCSENAITKINLLDSEAKKEGINQKRNTIITRKLKVLIKKMNIVGRVLTLKEGQLSVMDKLENTASCNLLKSNENQPEIQSRNRDSPVCEAQTPTHGTDKNERILKNVHPQMHYQSDYATKCVLCSFSGLYLANHYLHSHPTLGVLISRLPPATQQRIIANEANLSFRYMGKYQYVCPFCEIEDSKNLRNWRRHFGTHTGEYTYKCSNCNYMSNTNISTHIENHCPNAHAVQLQSGTTKEAPIAAFICELCNFIQMSRKNVIDHLISQHDCSEQPIIKIMLLNLETMKCEINKKRNPIITRKLKVLIKKMNIDAISKSTRVLKSQEKPVKRILKVMIRKLKHDTLENFLKPRENRTEIESTSPDPLICETVDTLTCESLDTESLNLNSDESLICGNILCELSGNINPVVNKMNQISESENSLVHSSAIVALTQNEMTMEKKANMTVDSKIGIYTEVAAISTNDGDDWEGIDNFLAIENNSAMNKSKDDTKTVEDSFSQLCAAHFYRINNLAYRKMPKNVIRYHCLVELCPFEYTDRSICLEDHVICEHPTLLWDGYCYGCHRQVTSDPNMDLVRELQHMKEIHIDLIMSSANCEPVNNQSNKTNIARSSLVKVRTVEEINKASFTRSLQIPSLIPFDKKIIELNDKEPNVIKQVFTGGVTPTSTTTVPRSNLKIIKVYNPTNITTSLPSASPSSASRQPFLKIANVSSIEMASSLLTDSNVHISSSSNVLHHSQLKIASVSNVAGTKSINSSTSVLPKSILKISKVESYANAKATSIRPSGLQHSQLKIASVSSAQRTKSTDSSTNVLEQSILKISKVESIAKTTSISNVKNASAHIHPRGLLHSQFKTTSDGIRFFDSSIQKQPQSNGVDVVTHLPTILKPWTLSKSVKSNKFVERLLLDFCLFATFKCMGNECAFATNDSGKMIEHLNNHLKYENGSSVYTTDLSSLECCYCSLWALDISQLISHIINKHDNDIYQCPYCFYRSCEEYNTFLHLKQHHPTEKELIFVCFGLKPLESNELHIARHGVRQNVKQINCNDCPKIFMNPLAFANHVETHASTADRAYIYKCAHCAKDVRKLLAVNHLMWNHKIAYYECVHCSFASDEKSSMNFHMANHHASNLLLCCIRTGMLNTTSHDEIHTVIDKDLGLIQLNKKIDNIYFQYCPFTENDLNVLDPALPTDQTIADSNLYQHNKMIIGPNLENVQSLGMEEHNMCSQTSQFLTPYDIDRAQGTEISTSELLFCPNCKYQTRVRNNLLRHLQLHKDKIIVSKINARNPVPRIISYKKLCRSVNSDSDACARGNILQGIEQDHTEHVSEKQDTDNTVYIDCNKETPLPSNERPKMIVANKMKWQCSLCTALTTTEDQMTKHIYIAHERKFRYECSKCNFGDRMSTYTMNLHANTKHPNEVSEMLCYYTKLHKDTDDTASIEEGPMFTEIIPAVFKPKGLLVPAVSANHDQSSNHTEKAFDWNRWTSYFK